MEKRKELENLQQNFDEFQEMSKAVEAELEGELQDVKTELYHAKKENSVLKEKIKELKVNPI